MGLGLGLLWPKSPVFCSTLSWSFCLSYRLSLSPLVSFCLYHCYSELLYPLACLGSSQYILIICLSLLLPPSSLKHTVYAPSLYHTRYGPSSWFQVDWLVLFVHCFWCRFVSPSHHPKCFWISPQYLCHTAEHFLPPWLPSWTVPSLLPLTE